MKIINRILIFISIILLIICLYCFKTVQRERIFLALKNERINKLDSLLLAEQNFILGNYSDAFNVYKLLGTNLKADSILIARKNRVNLTIPSKARSANNSNSLVKEEIEKLYLNKDFLLSDINDNLSIKDSIVKVIYKIELLLKHDTFSNAIKTFTPLKIVTKKGNKLNYFGGLNGKYAHGFGVAVLETGSIFYGNWQNNLRNGYGVFMWSDGEKYESNFIEDLRCGYGKYYFSNGDKYIGNWLNDKRNGFGILYDKNDEVLFKGNWKNDKPKKRIAGKVDW